MTHREFGVSKRRLLAFRWFFLWVSRPRRLPLPSRERRVSSLTAFARPKAPCGVTVNQTLYPPLTRAGKAGGAAGSDAALHMQLARDPTGTRPLFWTRHGDKIAFASEIQPLLRLPWVSRDLALDHIAEYLSFRYVHAPRTLYRSIHSIPPGHVLRLRSDGERMDRWWSPSWSPPGTGRPQDLADIPDRFDVILRRSVQKRIRSTHEDIAVLLSGGLDSSAILYHAAETCDRPLGFTLAWFQQHHPDWIMYRCDKKTVAFWGSETAPHGSVPIDFTNPAVVEWQMANQSSQAAALGYDSMAFDNVLELLIILFSWLVERKIIPIGLV